MTTFVRNSEHSDIKELLDNLRDEDRREAEMAGLDPLKSMEYAFTNSVYKKSLIHNGKLIAMFGLCGNLFGTVGGLYLVTTKAIFDMSPIRFARVYFEQVKIMSKIFPELSNYVDASYESAVRLLTIAGFTLEGPYLLGPDDSPFYLFSLKDLN